MNTSNKEVIEEGFIVPGRFHEVDGLRGIAILAVVIYHFGIPYGTYYPSDDAVKYNFSPGEMGVQLFFMISGFVILLSAIKSKSATRFAIARVSRLYPTYWAGLILSIILISYVGIETRKITISQALVNFTMLQRFLFVDNVDQVYWTLAVELQFYALMFIYLWFSRGKIDRAFITRFAIIWSLIGFILCVLFQDNSETGIGKILIWLLLAEHGPLFCYGMALFLFYNDRKIHWTLPFFGMIAVANVFVRHGMMQGIVVLTLSLFFFYVVWKGKVAWLAKGPLHFMGKVSYPWYICHTILGFVIIHLTQSHLGGWASITLAFIITLFVAYLLHRTVETHGSAAMKRLLFRNFPPEKIQSYGTQR